MFISKWLLLPYCCLGDFVWCDGRCLACANEFDDFGLRPTVPCLAFLGLWLLLKFDGWIGAMIEMILSLFVRDRLLRSSKICTSCDVSSSAWILWWWLFSLAFTKSLERLLSPRWAACVLAARFGAFLVLHFGAHTHFASPDRITHFLCTPHFAVLHESKLDRKVVYVFQWTILRNCYSKFQQSFQTINSTTIWVMKSMLMKIIRITNVQSMIISCVNRTVNSLTNARIASGAIAECRCEEVFKFAHFLVGESEIVAAAAAFLLRHVPFDGMLAFARLCSLCPACTSCKTAQANAISLRLKILCCRCFSLYLL